MGRTGSDKKSIDEQTEVIKKNNKITTILTVALFIVAILQLSTAILQLMILLK